MKTAFVTLLGTSAAMASDDFYLTTQNVGQTSLRKPDGTTVALGLLDDTTSLPTTGDSDIRMQCDVDESRSTSQYASYVDKVDIPSRDQFGRAQDLIAYMGTVVTECTFTLADGTPLQVIPPLGKGPTGSSVLLKNEGNCVREFVAPTTKTLDADDISSGKFHFSAGDVIYKAIHPIEGTLQQMPQCESGLLKGMRQVKKLCFNSADDCKDQDGDINPNSLTAVPSVTFKLGPVKSVLSDFVGDNVQSLHQFEHNYETKYDLGIPNANSDYFEPVTSCSGGDLCAGAVKVEWLDVDGNVVKTFNTAGFALDNSAKTAVNDMVLTNATETPTVFDMVVASDLYDIAPATATKDVNLITDSLNCGNSGESIPAYLTGDARANACRQALPKVHHVKCSDGQAGTIAVGSESFPYNYDESVLGQYDGSGSTPPVPQTKTVSVEYADFSKPLAVTFDDGFTAILKNTLSLADQSANDAVATSYEERRPSCDIVTDQVSHTATFQSAANYAEGPKISLYQSQRYPKYKLSSTKGDQELVNGVHPNPEFAGIKHPLVRWCKDLSDTNTDCGAAGDPRPGYEEYLDDDGVQRTTNYNWMLIDTDACRGATENDVGDYITFTGSSFTLLPSPIKCSNPVRFDLGSLNLQYGANFELSAFGGNSEISVSVGSSLSSSSSKTEGFYFAANDECNPDGSVGTAAAGCDVAPAANYTEVKAKFAACGDQATGTSMYLMHHVTFVMPDASELKFCNAKRLTYSIADQDGALTASIAVAARVGVDAMVTLQSLKWEQCGAGYEQVMVLDMTTNYAGTPTMTVGTNNYLHKDADTNLGSGVIILRSSCVDICAAPNQLTGSIDTEFDIEMGNDKSEFKISSQIQGNPCSESEAVDGIPDMQLKIENAEAGSCGSMPNVSASQISVGEKACFHLGTIAQAPSDGRKLNVDSWALEGADGVARTLTSSPLGLATNWNSVAEYIALTTDAGATLTLHVEFSQKRADGSSARRLRATYLLGAKDAGDADASFTVLPAHISVLDAAEDAPADAPAKATPAEDARTADIVTYLSGSVIGIAALVWLGQQAAKFMGGSARKLEQAGYAPVSRFTSATKY